MKKFLNSNKPKENQDQDIIMKDETEKKIIRLNMRVTN